jgi:regulator of nonsense transcripts 3
VRKDARQGTIDQDPEFIAFLESLTQPITKPATVDSIETEEKKAAVVTTPLVQFIKDKKASKAKESAAAKSSKRSEKESKQEKVQAKKLLQRPDKKLAPGPPSDEKPKGEKAGKESGKAAKAAAGGTSTKGGKPSTSSTTKETTSAAASERKRERGNVAAAAKILQRDLGLSQAPARRRGKGGANETGSTKNESSRESSAPAPEGGKKDTPAKPAKSAASSTRAKDKDGRESPSSRASGTATPVNAPAPSTKPAKGPKPKATTSPTPTATQAFLKHANASQGVTEALLGAAFTPFGTVTKVEIDKKKGFGYVDFAEPEGLQKAMAASPVSVAQSQVVVLERKANPGGEKSRKGAGGSSGGGRGDTAQPAKGEKAKASSNDGNGTTSGGGAGSGGGSSRGSRGGRGSRNKGAKGGDGSKGGPGGGAAPGEKSGGGSEAK